ncbi:MAG: TIGR00341 family protein [Sediminibacterium sp.]
MRAILAKFRMHNDKEDHHKVIEAIDSGIDFRGTNLWILIFAIFVASLGLNVNSTAVIIGAMLISPLMGPIMGIGLGMGINDLSLLRRAINNYLIATGVALATSTLFFLLSPLNDAHSEILARTAPNIYDVLIALSGGLAGILATASKQKGNVIPGVAIATALMPPLCTAGYGLATLQLSFFFGAFYLFIINTVFIALATFVTIRFLHFPLKHLQTNESETRAKRIVWVVVLITLLPSLYFGYTTVIENKFVKNGNRFILSEANFNNDYLLSKKIDAGKKEIQLVFGGKKITQPEIDSLKNKLKEYDLAGASLEVRQGFAYLADSKGENSEKLKQLGTALDSTEQQRVYLQTRMDSITVLQKLQIQVYAELKTQYPALKNVIIQNSNAAGDSLITAKKYMVFLTLNRLSSTEKEKVKKWLKVRLQQQELTLIIIP